MASGFCYIMTNRPQGVLYVGVTTNLPRRAYEHRMGLLEGFTSRYALTRLVHYEEYPLFMDGVRREKAIKSWPRLWKIALVEKNNPNWIDLYEQLLREQPVIATGMVRPLLTTPGVLFCCKKEDARIKSGHDEV